MSKNLLIKEKFMRLKGGKLLLDLSSLGDMPTDQQLLVYLLSYEEKKCIISRFNF